MRCLLAPTVDRGALSSPRPTPHWWARPYHLWGLGSPGNALRPFPVLPNLQRQWPGHADFGHLGTSSATLAIATVVAECRPRPAHAGRPGLQILRQGVSFNESQIPFRSCRLDCRLRVIGVPAEGASCTTAAFFIAAPSVRHGTPPTTIRLGACPRPSSCRRRSAGSRTIAGARRVLSDPRRGPVPVQLLRTGIGLQPARVSARPAAAQRHAPVRRELRTGTLAVSDYFPAASNAASNRSRICHVVFS